MLLGVAIYWVVARGLGRLLFGAIAADPVAFAGMLLVLTAIAALAGYLPARALRAWTRWRLCA
jgi:predicted anti-sigma-YlaC factor YlaD